MFHHNVLDIVSLACLTGLIPEAFRDPENMPARHGVDLLGLARWLRCPGVWKKRTGLMRRAVDMGLPDRHLFRALFEAGAHRKEARPGTCGCRDFHRSVLSPNPFACRAYEELAKHYEHREQELRMALECVRAARWMEDTEALALRQVRLEKKCAAASRQPKLRLNR